MDPDDLAAARHFRAYPPIWGLRWTYKLGKTVGYGLFLAFIGLFVVPILLTQLGVESLRNSSSLLGLAFVVVILVGGLVSWGGYWRGRQPMIDLYATSRALIVGRRSGDAFAFSEAQLGPWAAGMSMGSALHLCDGSRRFVLGGRDHRMRADIRMEAAPTPHVDAWVWAADFDELLALVGGRRFGGREPATPDAHRPAGSERTRCLLFPNPEMMSVVPARKVRRMAKAFQTSFAPSLAIDVGADEIRVVDPHANVLRGSAGIRQVTATPETYVLLRPFFVRWTYQSASDRRLRQSQYTSPVLVVNGLGPEPLTVSPLDERDLDLGASLARGTLIAKSRFWWGPEVPRRINRPAEYGVSSADWLALVETFGLTQYLEDSRRFEQR